MSWLRRADENLGSSPKPARTTLRGHKPNKPASTRTGTIDHISGVRGMAIMGNTAKHQIWPWPAIALLCGLETAAFGVFASWHLARTAFWYDESMQFWMSLGGDAFGPPHSPYGASGTSFTGTQSPISIRVIRSVARLFRFLLGQANP